jgi:hypothetical protein
MPQTAVFHAIGARGSASVGHTVKFLQAVPPPAAHPAPAADVASSALEGGAPGPFAYPGDNAPKPEIAKWMGEIAARHGLPRELPVMAALVESSLHNDAGGDRDSVGYFQMRTSIWDNGPYSGYAHNPALQVQWFIDHALQVKRENPALVNDPSRWGDWVADVERPAAQYRGRYQLQLDAARRLLSER